MIRGIYTSATGMGIEQLKQETITNNIANSSTVGYKKDTAVFQSFPDMLLARLGKEKDEATAEFVGKTNLGALVGDVVTSYKDGLLEETGNKFNLAISGDGFFVVETPQGERFTRDGNFTLNSEGYLVTQDGYRVKTENGYILVKENDLQVTASGEVFTNGQLVGKLRVQAFDNPNQLKKEGQNLFAIGSQVNLKDAENYSIHQNYLEKSNINLVEEIVELMTVVRAFEANQKLIQAQDDLLGKSVNELGSLR